MLDDDDDEDVTSVHTLDPGVLKQTRSRTAVVVVLGGRSEVGRVFHLSKSSVIGRGDGVEVRIDDEGVSRRHAQLTVNAGGVVELTDLGSTNGTFVNGNRITTCILKDGDALQIGGTAMLKFSFQDALDDQLTKNLYESATRDALTRLYNRKYFDDTLEKEFSYAHRHRVPLTLVLADLDHFKRINDTHGHPAGDLVLQRVAAVFTAGVRLEDVVCRYGGEEFALIFRATPQHPAMQVVERIRASIEACAIFKDENTRIPVTSSFGVATLVAADLHASTDFLKVADQALYQAKHSGRNRIVGTNC